MANGRDTHEIKRIRNETLVALKVVYPAALQADQILRSLLVIFPTLEFDSLKRDLHYLCDKRYIERVLLESEGDAALTPWRRRWFRLTTAGMELADHCIADPALDDA
ncbi:MAG: hypothetical protein HY287_04240 [Planctomycetes bacterium]|nr:hypothetical protein [Planctomycetota bacterium]MBI3833523.1 hypothetical protein [Planctomycetota bacterium]